MQAPDADVTAHSPEATYGGTWGQEARRVILLAAKAGLAVDDEALLMSDVRELMAWRTHLQQHLVHPKRWRWARRLRAVGRRVAGR